MVFNNFNKKSEMKFLKRFVEPTNLNKQIKRGKKMKTKYLKKIQLIKLVIIFSIITVLMGCPESILDEIEDATTYDVPAGSFTASTIQISSAGSGTGGTFDLDSAGNFSLSGGSIIVGDPTGAVVLSGKITKMTSPYQGTGYISTLTVGGVSQITGQPSGVIQVPEGSFQFSGEPTIQLSE